MKATGIVRRIDDLGRVVIPKEIRRTLRLREGTPLEIFTDREGEIILKKYSPMVELAAFATQYAESMAQSTGMLVCITDRDQVIGRRGGRGDRADHLRGRSHWGGGALKPGPESQTGRSGASAGFHCGRISGAADGRIVRRRNNAESEKSRPGRRLGTVRGVL